MPSKTSSDFRGSAVLILQDRLKVIDRQFAGNEKKVNVNLSLADGGVQGGKSPVQWVERREVREYIKKTGFRGSYARAERHYEAVTASYAYRKKNGYAFPSLTRVNSVSGGSKKKSYGKTVDYELFRISQCGNLFASFLNLMMGRVRHKRCYCMKQPCPGCGGSGGRIHKRRKHFIYEKINKLNKSYQGEKSLRVQDFLSRVFIRCHTFTVPDYIRPFFYDAKGIAWLMKTAKEIIEKMYGEPVRKKKNRIYKYRLVDKVGYMTDHLFSEDQPGVFHPHINIDVIENDVGQLRMISADQLSRMKKMWKSKLEKKTGMKIDDVVVEYGFKGDPKKSTLDNLYMMLHRLEYVTRPLNSEMLKVWKKNDQRRNIKLVLVGLKGFRHLRIFGKTSGKIADEKSMTEIGKELFPEGGKNKLLGFVTWDHVNSLVMDGLAIKLDDDSYENVTKSVTCYQVV